LKITDKLFFNTLMKYYNTITSANKKIKWTLQVVFTKCDLVERMELVRRIQLTRQILDEMLPRFANSLQTLAVSSKEGKGILELQKELISLIPTDMPNNHYHWYAKSYNTNSELDSNSNSNSNTKSNSNTNSNIDGHSRRNKQLSPKPLSSSSSSGNYDKYRPSSSLKRKRNKTEN